MFRQLATALSLAPGIPDEAAAANAVLTAYRPSQLSEFLEVIWGAWRNPARQAALGQALVAASHRAMARQDLIDPVFSVVNPVPVDPPWATEPVQWHHIVYAYMLENTRIVDIFRRVLYEWVHGERLSAATQDTQRWIHVTEQLFFPLAPWYSVRAVTSNIRPDSNAVRRNAYYRLLGMDLNHGTDDGRPYPYTKAVTANRDFAMVWETLLAEVWKSWANRNTSVAENLSDENAITNLVRRLGEMLQSRRASGTLSREEFEAVAMLSWFHLTVEFDTQIVIDLGARAAGIADRLKIIGERVGLPAHARSDAYIQLAVPMSNILLAIENGTITDAAQLYNGFYTPQMLEIITQWSVATGRNVKEAAFRQPLAVLSAAGGGFATVSSGNGASKVSNGTGVGVNRLAGVLR